MGQEITRIYEAGGTTRHEAIHNLQLLLRAHDDKMRVDYIISNDEPIKLVVYRREDESFPHTPVQAKRNPTNGMFLYYVIL